MTKDTIATATWVGLLGTVVLNALSYIEHLMGLLPTPPWVIAADVFLTAKAENTFFGLIIGLVGTFALGVGTSLLTALLLRVSGTDFAWLKGALAANTIGFGSMGLFMPILKISPNIQNEPWTNILALINLSVFGFFLGVMIKKHFQAKTLKQY